MAEIYMHELLKWPEAKQRAAGSRRHGPFKVGSFKTETFLKSELHKISARNIVLRTFHPERAHRRDGGIRVDAKAPWHPGVILDFEKPETDDEGNTRYIEMHLPCDTYRQWEDNLRAIAMVLEGLRMIDRHEVSQGAQYAGYKALPPAEEGAEGQTLEQAADFIAKSAEMPDAGGMVLTNARFADLAYKTAAKLLHPDKGGDQKEFVKLENSMRMVRESYGQARVVDVGGGA